MMLKQIPLKDLHGANKEANKKGNVSLIAQRVKIVFKERRKKVEASEAAGKIGRERERERGAERTAAFVPCFELFPEDRLTRAVFHPSGWRPRKKGNNKYRR